MKSDRDDVACCQCGHRLRVRFNDTSEGKVDLSRLILGPDAGVFAVLRDEALFRQARGTLGAVTWPGGLDLAPDACIEQFANPASGSRSEQGWRR